MIVDHAGGLHQRVTNGRADKLEAARQQGFTHGLRAGILSDRLMSAPKVAMNRDPIHKAPQEIPKAILLRRAALWE